MIVCGYIAAIVAMSVTGYCDSGVMASGVAVYDGACACGSGWEFGTEFVVDGRRYV